MISISRTILLLASIYTTIISSFNTLEDMQKYAALYDEYPDKDNGDWANPEYNHFYKSMKPGFFRSLAQTFHIIEQPLWEPALFKHRLELLMKQFPLNKQETVLGTTGVCQCMVITDLHGAFHSLIRILTDLEGKKVIDNNLKVLQKNVHIIFDGNVIDGSPYGLETLTVLCMLRERNPSQVWHIQGGYERLQRWHTKSLASEITERLSGVFHNSSHVRKILDTYFQGLPQAWYVVGTSGAARISSVGFNDAIEDWLGNFFQSLQPEHITVYSYTEHKKTNPQLPIKVVIEGRHSWNTIVVAQPLLLIKSLSDGDMKLPMTWQLSSTQTRKYRQLYRFFYDAYAIIDFKEKFDESVLTLRARDVRHAGPFINMDCYNLVKGGKNKSCSQ